MSDSRSRSVAGFPTQRLWGLAICLFLGWTVVGAHLIGISLSETGRMQHRITQQQTVTESIPARPGDILDRNGQLLATSLDTESLFAVPKAMEDFDPFISVVAPLLSLDPEPLRRKLESHRDKGFVWIARRLDPEQAQAIRKAELPAEWYGFEREFRRHYPQGEVAVHLIGLRDIDGQGRGGIEQAYHSVLRGQDGQRVLIRDAHHRVVHLYEQSDRRVQHGQTLRLTIDLLMQRIVEQELDQVQQEWQPTGCCAILCEPRTGDILAMASRPHYHPERPETFVNDVWLNRAVAWTYEPGSTMKPLIVAWAMQEKLVSPASSFFVHWGAYHMGRRILHDTHPYGELSLAEVLIKSSNIGMAQIGEKLTNTGLAEALNRFGFGFRTGSGLPGELEGLVRPLHRWTSYSTGSIPMGQELSVTPLQMIVAHSILANGGLYQQPRLVLEMEQSRTPTANITMPVIDPAICEWLLQDPLTRVLSEGTGRRVAVDGLPIFGKTGTSQIYDPELKGYSPDRVVCSFLCGLPAEKPELILIVVVDQPQRGESHYGGTVAAPAAVRILKQCYALQSARITSTPVEQPIH